MTTNTTGRWEYHIEKVYGALSVERLNALGADRWELVSAATGVDNAQVLIFKRPGATLAEQITIDQRTRVQGEREAGA
ncbi:MAG: hypothetical protein ACTHMX_03975 [Thermomicrobiales bacterium]